MTFRKTVRYRSRPKTRRGRGQVPSASTRKRPALRVHFISKDSLKRLTAAEERKCNNLLFDCFENAEVGRLIDGTCVIGMLGKQVVAFLCVSDMSSSSSTQTAITKSSSPNQASLPDLLIHTVCTSGKYRGRGLMRQMFQYMSHLPEFANRSFQLSASNLVERDAGLNQSARFKIYSKVGFAIPIGTELRPSGEIVKDVSIDHSNREILYHLEPRSITGTTIVHRKSGDMVIDTCYMNSELQERGCIMRASVDAVKAFTDRD